MVSDTPNDVRSSIWPFLVVDCGQGPEMGNYVWKRCEQSTWPMQIVHCINGRKFEIMLEMGFEAEI